MKQGVCALAAICKPRGDGPARHEPPGSHKAELCQRHIDKPRRASNVEMREHRDNDRDADRCSETHQEVPKALHVGEATAPRQESHGQGAAAQGWTFASERACRHHSIMKILVIEDEPRAASYLRQGLTEAGFTVDVAADGESGLAAARLCDYSLVLCDVMLPRRDGFSVIGELRRAGRTAPILLVTARNDVDDRVRGLDLGADDYLVKPFAFAELLARVRAVLRRAPIREPDAYRIADLVCNPRTRRVERCGQRLDLTPKEFALLQLLCEHAGEVLSRTLIAERVWEMSFDSDTNAIDVQVRRLRSKIEPPGTTPLIHTVRGVGYVLEARVEEPA